MNNHLALSTISKDSEVTDNSKLKLLNYDPPAWLPRHMWDSLDEQQKIQIEKDHMNLPAAGIPMDIWQSLSAGSKKIIRELDEQDRERNREKNLVAAFFCTFYDITAMEKLGVAVSTLAVVNALLLTIPFSLMGNLNEKFFSDLETKISQCQSIDPGYYQYIKDSPNMIKTVLASSMYSGITGILLSGLYTTFSPNKNDYETMSLYQIKKQRVLGFMLFAVTFVTYASVCFLANDMFDFYATNNVCYTQGANNAGKGGLSGKYSWPGNWSIGVLGLFALYLMM